MRMKQHLLSEHWLAKKHDVTRPLSDDLDEPDGWFPATVPGTIHQDLLAANAIPDPFLGLNENKVQWIGECDWIYHCVFDFPSDCNEAECVALCCEGLDTFATVWLNGTQVLVSDNMFLPQRVQVKPLLRAERNELTLLFESALRCGKERAAHEGQRAVWMGDPSRVYVRKAQYQYGWDWGPTLLTVGPWRAIALEAYTARITELWCPIELSPDLQWATITTQTHLEQTRHLLNPILKCTLSDPAGQDIDQIHLPIQEDTASGSFMLAHPQVWWPHGYGTQPRYQVCITLKDGDQVIDQQVQSVGMRTLRLLQEYQEGDGGTSFGFTVNGVNVFCGGANWIPADSFLSRLTPDRYRELVTRAADANMTMLRVWGGGIYEPDVFYDTCDELGILVWQDFMFACGIYPASADFQASIRAEVTTAIKHLRHHPCLALWCGNNEDYLLAAEQGMYPPGTADDAPILLTFPARELYEHVIPAICQQLDPARPYWPGSPYLGTVPNDSTQGDQHVWDVWHGMMADYHTYPQFVGRFISEFGMQAFPSMETLTMFTDVSERNPHSRVVEYHNKLVDGPRRLAVYVNDTVPTPEALDAYTYATQLVQTEALVTALGSWRHIWQRSGGRWAGGALIWQFNDCWPAISWSLIDYFGRPKPAYYAMRRVLAPLVIGLERTPEQGVTGWVINMMPHPLEASFLVYAWNVNGSLIAEEQQFVSLAPFGSQELLPVTLPIPTEAIISAQLVQQEVVLARASLWPEPFKYLTLPDPGMRLKWHDPRTLHIQVERPAKGVWFSNIGDAQWSDNMLDLFPNDVRLVTIAGEIDPQALRLQRVGRMGLHVPHNVPASS